MVNPSRKFFSIFSRSNNEELNHGALEEFNTSIATKLSLLYQDLVPASGVMSLMWIYQCLTTMYFINSAFTKLHFDIEYPVTEWDLASIDFYFNLSFKFMDFLNCMRFSLNHIELARIRFIGALKSAENSPSCALEYLEPIKLRKDSIDYSERRNRYVTERSSSTKARVIHDALQVVKDVQLYLCGIVLSALFGDFEPFFEMRKLTFNSVSRCLLTDLDSVVCGIAADDKVILKDLEELNEAAEFLASKLVNGETVDAANAVKLKLCNLDGLMNDLRDEVGNIFDQLLAKRTVLTECLCARMK